MARGLYLAGVASGPFDVGVQFVILRTTRQALVLSRINGFSAVWHAPIPTSKTETKSGQIIASSNELTPNCSSESAPVGLSSGKDMDDAKCKGVWAESDIGFPKVSARLFLILQSASRIKPSQSRRIRGWLGIQGSEISAEV